MSTHANEAGADSTSAGGLGRTPQQAPLIDPSLSTAVNQNPGGYEELHKKTKGSVLLLFCYMKLKNLF